MSEICRRSDVLDMLRPHILVNSIADYYEISALKNMANKNIRDLCENCWRLEGAAAAVYFALANTSDPEVYSMLSTALVNTFTHNTLESMHWEQFIQKNVVNRVSLGVIQETTKRMKASERQLELAEEDINDLRLAGERALESSRRRVLELEEEVERMKRAIETLDSTTYCRYCDKSWEGARYIETTWPYTVRCSECMSRQYMED